MTSPGRSAALFGAVVLLVGLVGFVVVRVRGGERTGTSAAGRTPPVAAAEPAGVLPQMKAPPGRPSRPPGPGEKDRPAPPPEPALPRLGPEERALLLEKVRRDPHPGLAAFRLLSDRYVDDNAAMAAEQAKKEGLTLAEVRELTHFGLLAMATQRVEDLEDIIGHPLDAETRAALSKLLATSDQQFEAQMRELVAKGGGESERWALIRGMESRYLEELERLTGLDEEKLDDLLAGNLGLPGAPAAGLPAPDPRGVPRDDDRGPRDTVTPPPRPSVP